MYGLKDITIISYILQEDVFYDVSYLDYLQSIFLRILKPTVSPLLSLASSHNLLLLQSPPTNTPYRQGNVRRRKDDTRVGTAARRNVERLSCFPRRLHADGRSSG